MEQLQERRPYAPPCRPSHHALSCNLFVCWNSSGLNLISVFPSLVKPLQVGRLFASKRHLPAVVGSGVCSCASRWAQFQSPRHRRVFLWPLLWCVPYSYLSSFHCGLSIIFNGSLLTCLFNQTHIFFLFSCCCFAKEYHSGGTFRIG